MAFLTLEDARTDLHARGFKTSGPRGADGFMAQCPLGQRHAHGDRTPSVSVTLGQRHGGHKRVVVMCHGCEADWRDIFIGWGWGELVEAHDRAQSFRRIGPIPVPVTNVGNLVNPLLPSLPTLVTRLGEAQFGGKHLTRQFREDVLRVAADLEAHRAAYDRARCALPILYATSYCGERMGWAGSVQVVKVRASRALCWLVAQGYLTPDAPVGRTKTYRLGARA